MTDPGSPQARRSPQRAVLLRSTFSGLTSQYTGAAITGLGQLVVTAVLARLLSPTDYGLVGLATVYIGLASLFSQFGLGVALVQRPELTPRDLRAGFTIAVLLGLFTTALVWLTAPLVAQGFHSPALTPVVRWLSLSFVLSSPGFVAQALSERHLAWRRLMWIEVAAFTAGNAVPAICLASLGYGVWALVGSTLGQTAVRTMLLLRAQPHPKNPRLGPEIRELLRFGSSFTLARLFNYGALQGDNLVVGRVLGIEPLGFYSRAFKLMLLPVTYFAMIVTKVLFPVMARLQHEPAQLRTAYLTGSSVIALVSAPVSIVMVVIAPELVHVVLGPRWAPVIVPFQILTLAIVMRNAYLMAYCLDGALGAMQTRTIRDGIYALSVVVGSLAGSRFGLAGVATGVLLAIMVNYFVAAGMSLRMVQATWSSYATSQLPGFALGIGTAAVAWPLRLGLLALGLPAALVIVATAAVVTALAVLLIVRWPSLVGSHGRHALRLASSALAPKLPGRGGRWMGDFAQSLQAPPELRA